MDNQTEPKEEEIVIENGVMGKGNNVVIKKVPLKKIKLGRNSRLNVSKEELHGMMQSIKETGLLQPIGVIDRSGHYEICYGNRRFLAASKLGFSTIPCMIHKSKKESDVDLKNLTENIQRRNVSLNEIGRYVTILQDDGMTTAECAVRLGVSKQYIQSCLTAHQEVPEEFRNDLEVRIGGVSGENRTGNTAPGKISIKVARQIVSAGKGNKLSLADQKLLYRAAKSDERFKKEHLPEYIKALSQGKKSFLDEATPTVKISMTLLVTEKDYDKLHKKHVEEGPFKNMHALIKSILKGEKSETLDIVN